MKKAIFFFLLCCSFLSINAQLDKPDYLIFDIGKQTNISIFKTLYDDYNSLVLDAGMGYEHPINNKWSWSTEFLLVYRRNRNSRSRLLMEEDSIKGVQLLKGSNTNFELSIPIYLRRKLRNGLILTGGLATNLTLASEYTLQTIERMGSRSGGSTRRSSNWLEGLQINGNVGLQVPISDYADLRFNLQQPIWVASFRGFESGFYRFSNFRFTFGINYQLDHKQ